MTGTNDYAELRRRTDAERVLFGEFNNDPMSVTLALLDARDHIDTLTRERDEARKDTAAMREMLATAFREGWNCGDWKEDRDNVSSREYDWMHSAVKAKADAALTQGDA